MDTSSLAVLREMAGDLRDFGTMSSESQPNDSQKRREIHEVTHSSNNKGTETT
jgi:hypothetical protein